MKKKNFSKIFLPYPLFRCIQSSLHPRKSRYSETQQSVQHYVRPINSYPFNIFNNVHACQKPTVISTHSHARTYTHVRYSFPKTGIHKEKQQNTFIPVIFHGRLPPTLMSHSAARISLSLSHLSRISYERIHANRSVFSPR